MPLGGRAEADMNMIKKLLKQREAAIVLIVLGLSIIMTIASSVFPDISEYCGIASGHVH